MKLVYQENRLIQCLPEGAVALEAYRNDPSVEVVDTDKDPNYSMKDGCLLRQEPNSLVINDFGCPELVPEPCQWLVWFPEGREVLVIPEGVRYIEELPERCVRSLRAVFFPESMETLTNGDMGFAGCQNLKRVYLSRSVRWVGPNAFAGCTGLEAVVVPNPMTYFSHRSNPAEEGMDAFDGVDGVMFFCGENPWMNHYMDRHRFVRRPVADAAELKAADRVWTEDREAGQARRMRELTDVWTLDLEDGTCEALQRHGAETLADLIWHTGRSLRDACGLTEEEVERIGAELARRGLSLRREAAEEDGVLRPVFAREEPVGSLFPWMNQ